MADTKKNRKNKKTLTPVQFFGVLGVFLVGVGGYAYITIAEPSSVSDNGEVDRIARSESLNVQVTNSQKQKGADADIDTPTPSTQSRPPATSNVHDTVESLAQQYVSGSIDEGEALAYLAHVRSARLARTQGQLQEQQLRNARFETDLAQTQLEQERIRNEREGLSGQNQQRSVLDMPTIAPVLREQRAGVASLDEYRLQSITEAEGIYRARISVRGQTHSVAQGDMAGDVRIASITATSVELERGRDTRTLYGLGGF